MFGLAITWIGSSFLFRVLTDASPMGLPVYLYFSLIMCLGLFAVYAGVQSFRTRLSVLNWILSCVLLTVYGAIVAYTSYVIDGVGVALLGMVGVILSVKYEKYQLRKSLKTPSKTQ